MQMRHLGLATCVICVQGIAFGQSVRFEVADLGRVPGYEYATYPVGLNNHGDVVGFGHSGSMYKAFKWTASTGMQVLPPVPGHESDSSTATGINDLGEIIGFSGQDNGVDYIGWVYRNGQYTMLGSRAGFRGCKPLSINNSSEVIGRTTTIDFSYQVDSFVWSPTTGLQDGSPGIWAEAYALNDLGVMVGGVRNSPPPFGMLAWNIRSNSQTDLGAYPGGTNCLNFGTCINNLGQVVGVSGCRMISRAVDGTMTDITPLMLYPGAVWLNDNGWVLGTRPQSCSNGTCRGSIAWVRTSGAEVFDLDNALVGTSHSSIGTARVINNRNQIIAMANGSGVDGSRRGVLLTPQSPPCAADFNADGVLDFFDYLDFVSVFSSGLVAADFNHDSIIDLFDYLDFVEAFAGGC